MYIMYILLLELFFKKYKIYDSISSVIFYKHEVIFNLFFFKSIKI